MPVRRKSGLTDGVLEITQPASFKVVAQLQRSFVFLIPAGEEGLKLGAAIRREEKHRSIRAAILQIARRFCKGLVFKESMKRLVVPVGCWHLATEGASSNSSSIAQAIHEPIASHVLPKLVELLNSARHTCDASRASLPLALSR